MLKKITSLLLAAFLYAAPGHAQQGEPMADAYRVLDQVNLYAGSPPGFEDWPGNLGITEEGVFPGETPAIYNVSIPRT